MKTLLAFLLTASTVAAQDPEPANLPPLTLDTPGQTFTLTGDMHFAGSGIVALANNITIDLNGHTLYFGSDNKSGGDHTTPGSYGIGSGKTYNVTIKNGRIIHDGSGNACHGIYSRGDPHFTVQDVEIVVNGKDSGCVYQYWAGATLKNNVFRCNSASTFNRHSGPANVRVGGKCEATGNVLIGGNSGFNVGSGSEIKGNVIAHNSHATNGYGVWLYVPRDVLVENNLIVPSNGRGVLLNSGRNVRVTGNTILFWDTPNAEYGDSLNACAIRARYDLFDNVIAENVGLGVGGEGYTGCSSLYLGNTDVGQNTYEKNHFTTILRGAPDSRRLKYAKALALENQNNARADADIIRGNTLRSNHLLVASSGYDGACGGQTIRDCDFWHVDGATAAKEFVAAMQAKLAEIGLDDNDAAKEIVAARAAQITAELQDEPIRPEAAFWYCKHWVGTEKCVVEASRYHNTDPATYVAHAPNYSGSVYLEAAGIVRITKPAEANTPITVTPIEPPAPADPRDGRIAELEQALASETAARQQADKLAEELRTELAHERTAHLATKALVENQRNRMESAVKILIQPEQP